jgi:hypothetical protein
MFKKRWFQRRVEVSCLVAREEGAPEGVKPVEWRLLTNRTIATPLQQQPN